MSDRDVDKVLALMAMVVSSTFEEERRSHAVRAVMLIHEKGLTLVSREQTALLTPFGPMPVAAHAEEPLRAEPWAREAGWEEKWAVKSQPAPSKRPEPVEDPADAWHGADPARVIASRYAGRCRVCGKKHVQGDAVVYQREVVGVWCLKCKPVT